MENPSELPAPHESYMLTVNSDGVLISASSEAGLFYGIQSLLQMVENRTSIPFVKIEDAPRFSYRGGAMIDCSRHFVSLDFLKKQIDLMAYYKLNRFTGI